MRILVVENLKKNDESWWKKYLPSSNGNCRVETINIRETGLLGILIPLLRLYIRLNEYDVIITHQDGYATFFISFLNTLLRRKRPRHFIDEFITREKNPGIYSWFKYALLRFSLSSVFCIMCSSRLEIEYYKKYLDLKKTKFEFVPLGTNPIFLDIESNTEGDYILSAGRTGRDYETLLNAVKDLPVRLILVCDYHNVAGLEIPPNVEVKYNIPLSELIKLKASAKFVVLTLQDKPISIGQSVLLEAMALGKAVIVTKIAGIVDYIENDATGIFVEANDINSLKDAIQTLLLSPNKAVELGLKARKSAKTYFLIGNKINHINKIVRNIV